MLSEASQCFHLEFAIDSLERFHFDPGQFVTFVASHPTTGKPQTRAYSLASAPCGNLFALCVNRVEGGFFSNLLCDLEEGSTLPMYGPNGDFTLHAPLTDSLLIATGTGIAPMRGFLQWLFAPHLDRSQGKRITLVYGTRYETDIYYRDFFETLANTHANLEYIVTLSRAGEQWAGQRGYVQENFAQFTQLTQSADQGGAGADATPPFAHYAYLCGLNAMVSASRERLKTIGWHRRQVLVERYD